MKRYTNMDLYWVLEVLYQGSISILQSVQSAAQATDEFTKACKDLGIDTDTFDD